MRPIERANTKLHLQNTLCPNCGDFSEPLGVLGGVTVGAQGDPKECETAGNEVSRLHSLASLAALSG